MKTKRERVSVVVIHEGKLLGFHAEDPTSHRRYFFPPGGLVESGESPGEAAVRETLEETGYQITLLPGVSVTRRYDFKWNGRIHDCETVFFAGKLLSTNPAEVIDADYHQGVGWIALSEIKSTFAYHEVIQEAVVVLTKALTGLASLPK